MSSPHRPLSEWVAEVVLNRDGTGSWDPWAEPNRGRRDSDARGEPRFRDGWQRRRILLDASGDRVGALCLIRGGTAPEVVAELTDAGVPVPVGEAAIAVVERLEEAWPDVRPEPDDLRVLAGESAALRWSLVERLRQEGDPAAEVFHVLPWELVERLAGDLCGAIDAGGGASAEVLAHWFAPTGSAFSDAMDELNLWLRDHGTPGLADHGGIALCEELAGADLALFPARTLRALAALTRRLTAADPAMGAVGQEATTRLTSAASSAPERLDAHFATADRPASAPGAAIASGPPQTPPSEAAPAFAETVSEWLRELSTVGPGEWTADSGGLHLRLSVTEEEDTGEVALQVTPPVGDVPVLVRPEADRGAVTYLGWLTAGRMRLEVDSPPPYEVRPAPRRRDSRTAPFEVITSKPRRLESALASDAEEEPRDDRLLVVPDLDLEVNAYEAGDGRLYVSASVGSREADGRWLELVLHGLGDGSARECVIPLRWAHDAAEGTLSVGTWRDRLTIAVGAGLVDDPSGFTHEAVRWSAEHAADERTRDALRDLLAALGGPDGSA
ncbi:hypothetical protein [Actinomadura bangladeshensis]|uniref:Uncharacterized protein n=1 Tax=Actinomadura bangladeshensis TaxID=453573 RepID=A0A4R4P6V5_9ACTN|nr:hypothetical protein [Actinomadura bangladeshensis]TDC16573.1 hypothetical protein E1284_11975 [Actinomadura bangladeshensis]